MPRVSSALQLNAERQKYIHTYVKEVTGIPFGTSVSLSASESEAIAFLRFIRKTSSSLSLPLADSVKSRIKGSS